MTSHHFGVIWRHQIVIFIQVVTDAYPWFKAPILKYINFNNFNIYRAKVEKKNCTKVFFKPTFQWNILVQTKQGIFYFQTCFVRTLKKTYFRVVGRWCRWCVGLALWRGIRHAWLSMTLRFDWRDVVLDRLSHWQSCSFFVWIVFCVSLR